MEIIKLLALLIGSAILFACCAAHPAPNLSYQEKAFRAHILCESDNFSFGAILTSIPLKDSEESAERDLTLKFISPDTLCGIKVQKRGEKVTVSLNEMEISAPHALSWLALAELFDIEATVKESSVESLDGQKLNFINAVADDGREFSLYLYPASGLPRRISGNINGKPTTIDVISFEFISEANQERT